MPTEKNSSSSKSQLLRNVAVAVGRGVKTHKKEVAIAGGGMVAAVLAALTSKAGIPEIQDLSVQKSRKKELADENFLNLSDIPAGTVLICELMQITHHSGIYLGNGKVAELFGDGRYQSVSLKEFLHGAPGENYRTGTHVYAACNTDGKPLGSTENRLVRRMSRNARAALSEARRITNWTQTTATYSPQPATPTAKSEKFRGSHAP